jgi:BirA family transcriptional regulator, biotin operon repressor / biotin---[acetyl-CoA-carboxylase] ligase
LLESLCFAPETSLIARPVTIRSELPTDARLERVVRVLADHATVVVSGTKLAQELATTRSEVWRLVQHLRGLGVEIAGHPATGYQLAAVADLLLPAFVAPLVRGTLFERGLRHFFKIDSTNLAAMAAAQEGAPEGTVLLAEEQTAGRGRGGHGWHSAPSSGVYLSAILRPPMPPADALLLSLAAGLAIADGAAEITGIRPDLRWPNDLLIGEKKFCGILTEMQAEPTRVRHVVVGIGINVNHDALPPDLAPIATSLRVETGRTFSRVALTAAVLKALDREYRNLRDRASIIRRFEQVSSYARGKQVHVEEEGGYDGVTAGLDAHGFLRVETGGGTRTVLSGGVRAK